MKLEEIKKTALFMTQTSNDSEVAANKFVKEHLREVPKTRKAWKEDGMYCVQVTVVTCEELI